MAFDINVNADRLHQLIGEADEEMRRGARLDPALRRQVEALQRLVTQATEESEALQRELESKRALLEKKLCGIQTLQRRLEQLPMPKPSHTLRQIEHFSAATVRHIANKGPS